jgi:hypothetical protein
MFIDEGFGSLDENSIGDALDILEASEETPAVSSASYPMYRFSETVSRQNSSCTNEERAVPSNIV